MTCGAELKIATRGSELARWQANAVRRELEGLKQGASGELVIVSTAGDRDLASSLSEIGGKGVFVKEVQAAVLAGEADIAVHSAKDMPAETPEGLTIGAVLKRGDPRDALVGSRLADLPNGATVATGAPRRRAQLAALRPDLHFAELRGNIATRLAKAGNYDAIVVAVAALERLGFAKISNSSLNKDSEPEGGIVGSSEALGVVRSQESDNLNLDTEVEGIGVVDVLDTGRAVSLATHIKEVEGIGIIDVLDPEIFVPQVGQGVIAVECRSDDTTMKQMLTAINHSPTRICLEAERGFLQALGDDCNLPAGAYAQLLPHQSKDKAAIYEATLEIIAFVATADDTSIRDTVSLSLDLTDPISIQTASTTGQALANRIAGGIL